MPSSIHCSMGDNLIGRPLFFPAPDSKFEVAKKECFIGGSYKLTLYKLILFSDSAFYFWLVIGWRVFLETISLQEWVRLFHSILRLSLATEFIWRRIGEGGEGERKLCDGILTHCVGERIQIWSRPWRFRQVTPFVPKRFEENSWHNFSEGIYLSLFPMHSLRTGMQQI